MLQRHSRIARSRSISVAVHWGLTLSVLAPLSLQASSEPLEEVIVTSEGVGALRLDQSNDSGSRLGLSALATPASVAVITGEEMLSKGDVDALSAVTRAPGVSAVANPGNGGTAVSMRGFNGHNAVMTLLDGTRLYVTAGTVTFPIDTGTLARVEIVSGAGSVINGLGAIGGMINYVPKRPKPGETDAQAELTVGSFDLRRVTAGGGHDLNADWAWRLDGVHQSSDSDVQRTHERREVGAGSLLFHPDTNLSWLLSADYSHVHEDAPYFGTPLINGQASRAQRRQNYNFADGFLDYRDLWLRSRVEWQWTRNISLRNDTYRLTTRRQWQNLEVYRYNSGTNLIDRDGESYYGIIHDQAQLGTRTDVIIEHTLAGHANRVNIGFDANRIDLDYSNNWSQGLFYAGNSVPVFGWTPDSRVTAAVPTVLAFSTRLNQWSVFADDHLTLNDQWSVLLGARVDRTQFKRHDYALGGNAASSFNMADRAWSLRGGLIYQPQPSMSVYAQFSRAADPVSSPVTVSASNKDWQPARGRQWEVGVKQQFMDGQTEYTLAWFDIVKQGLVTRVPGSAISQQVGQQSSQGVEAALRLSPLKRLAVDVNAAWVAARFDEFYQGGRSLAGNTPNNVPTTTANLWLNWAVQPMVTLGAGVRYVGTRYADDGNQRRLPAYQVVDAKAGFKFNADWQALLRVRNLTNNSHYILSEYDVNQWVFGEPRAYELSVRYGY